MGALLPTEHQEEFHRQSSAGATLKSTLPKQGRDDLEVFFKQTSFLVLMLKKRAKSSSFRGSPQLVAWAAGPKMHQPGIEPGSHRWQRCILPLDH